MKETKTHTIRSTENDITIPELSTVKECVEEIEILQQQTSGLKFEIHNSVDDIILNNEGFFNRRS